METQRALIIILPVLMIAVLAVGLFFGYKSYQKQAAQVRELEHSTYAPEPTEPDPMLLTAVNTAKPLSSDYVPEITEACGVQVSPLMADSLERMIADAEAAGYHIVAHEGYISYEEQKQRYKDAVAAYRKKTKATIVKAEAYVKRTTPREGESEQQTGLVVYLNDKAKGVFSDSPEYAWLIKNCMSYGFVLRYPKQENVGGLSYSSHLFRYVGEEYAYFITAYDMTFDEYAVYLASQ